MSFSGGCRKYHFNKDTLDWFSSWLCRSQSALTYIGLQFTPTDIPKPNPLPGVLLGCFSTSGGKKPGGSQWVSNNIFGLMTIPTPQTTGQCNRRSIPRFAFSTHPFLLIGCSLFLAVYFAITMYHLFARVKVRSLSFSPLLKVFFRCVQELLPCHSGSYVPYRDAAGYCFM